MKWKTLDAGVSSALLAAVLFGASTPLAKRLIQDVDPWMLAGLLYLGSGLGLAAHRAVRRVLAGSGKHYGAVRGADRLWLGSAILSGGVLAPVLMMYGLARTAASASSLLLNLEGVFTTLIAWCIFRENFDRRIALGVLAITAGAVLLSVDGTFAAGGLIGPLAIAGACLAWAIDNNLTGRVSLGDATQIAMLKGLAAGTVNVSIAAAMGNRWPQWNAAAVAGGVGFVGYGISLVLFVVALRHLGAARTGAYFSTAPFVGAAVAVLFGEPLTVQLMTAGLLMGVGLWLHLTERHEHEHVHEPLFHEHLHVHDDHHRHSHPPGQMPDLPHSHWHSHPPRVHTHHHFPDAHHRHGHSHPEAPEQL